MVRPKSQIDILASLVHPRGKNWRHRFVMVEAYFDESGIHEGARVCVVGGYYANQAVWRSFEKQWNKVLADYPEVKKVGFHAKVFFGRKSGKRVGEYTDWSDEKASKFVERLVQVIMRTSIFPIGYAVVVDDFRALPLNGRRWLTGGKFRRNGKYVGSGSPNKPYYVPFQFCVLDSARMSRANPVDKIHFFVGLDKSFSDYASDLYRYILNDQIRLPENYRNLLGGISYPLSKDTPGIQAADFLVNRLYHFLLQKVAAKKNLPVPKLIEVLTKNRLHGQRFAMFDSNRFKQLEALAQAEAERFWKAHGV